MTFTLGRAAPSLSVADMNAALAFWRDGLGFDVPFTNGDPVIFAIVRRDAAELHLTLNDGMATGASNAAHLLVSAGVDTFHDAVVAAGGEIVKPLQDMEFGLRAFVFSDPFGNRIDVGQVND